MCKKVCKKKFAKKCPKSGAKNEGPFRTREREGGGGKEGRVPLREGKVGGMVLMTSSSGN